MRPLNFLPYIIPAKLWDRFLGISPVGLTLFSNLMKWDPSKRWTAQQASKSIYFDELPMPTPDSAMPRFHDTK